MWYIDGSVYQYNVVLAARNLRKVTYSTESFNRKGYNMRLLQQTLLTLLCLFLPTVSVAENYHISNNPNPIDEVQIIDNGDVITGQVLNDFISSKKALPKGGYIRLTSDDVKVVIQSSNGNKIIVQEAQTFQIPDDGIWKDLKYAYFKIKTALRIEYDGIVAGVDGTEFEARKNVDGPVTINVLKGRVWVISSAVSMEKTYVSAGKQVRLQKGQPVPAVQPGSGPIHPQEHRKGSFLGKAGKFIIAAAIIAGGYFIYDKWIKSEEKSERLPPPDPPPSSNK